MCIYFCDFIVSDSWSLYPIGILTGTTHQMGVYDECISVQHPVRGKYCIPTVQISSTAGIDFSAGNRDQSGSNDHAWQEILGVPLRVFLFSLTLEGCEM